jgi:hypothetical protein
VTSSRAQGLRSQNEQVVTFTLVELLTALTFIAMLLALVLKTEALAHLDPAREHVRQLQDQLEAAQTELRADKREIATLTDELEEQRSLVRRLMAASGKPLPPNDVVVVPREAYDQSRTAKAVAQEQQEEIAGLQKQIAALRGGATLVRPWCATNPGFLLNVQLNADGSFTARPNWPAVANSSVAQVDGLSALTSGTLSKGAFASAAQRVDHWGNAQKVPCAFRVKVSSGHGNLPLYLRQLSAVEQHFYVSRTR